MRVYSFPKSVPSEFPCAIIEDLPANLESRSDGSVLRAKVTVLTTWGDSREAYENMTYLMDTDPTSNGVPANVTYNSPFATTYAPDFAYIGVQSISGRKRIRWADKDYWGFEVVAIGRQGPPKPSED